MSLWRVLALLMWFFVVPGAFIMFLVSPLFLGNWIYVWLGACGVVIAASIISNFLHRLARDE